MPKKAAFNSVSSSFSLMKIISDTNPIIHELSKDVSSCTSSFFMPNRHFHFQMLYYTRRPRDLAFGLLNFRKGFFLWRELLPIRSQPGSPGKMFLDFFGRRVFPNICCLSLIANSASCKRRHCHRISCFRQDRQPFQCLLTLTIL